MATIVEQLLTHKGRNTFTVHPDDTVGDAVAILGEHQIGAVMVCSDGEVLGVLSERDCMRKVLWERQCTLESPVREAMRGPVISVSPRDSIQQCMNLMNDRRIRHLPVLERGELVGVISIGDVINALIRDQEYLIESLEGYISGSPSVRPAAH
jgi:CBS domain-containing protein